MSSKDTPKLESIALSTAFTFHMPMPLLGVVGIPLFEGANATEFLNRFNNLCKEYQVLDQDKLAKLLKYCSRNISNTIKLLKAQKNKDYLALQKAILKEYKNYNSYQQIYSLKFLKKYKSIVYTEKDNIL